MARLLAKNAMEPLSKGRLKVAAEAIMTDNSTSSFAEKRENDHCRQSTTLREEATAFLKLWPIPTVSPYCATT